MISYVINVNTMSAEDQPSDDEYWEWLLDLEKLPPYVTEPVESDILSPEDEVMIAELYDARLEEIQVVARRNVWLTLGSFGVTAAGVYLDTKGNAWAEKIIGAGAGGSVIAVANSVLSAIRLHTIGRISRHHQSD